MGEGSPLYPNSIHKSPISREFQISNIEARGPSQGECWFFRFRDLKIKLGLN